MTSLFSLAVDVEKRQMVARTHGNATDLACDSVSFSVGNPRVEHIQGIAHLYRDMASPHTSSTESDKNRDLVFAQQDNLGSHVAVLAVQPDMGVSEFCTFMGGYLPSVREMRFVRRDDAPRGDCLVLLKFDNPARAAQFYLQHNNKPFWTLEPDILCRLVFVKDVQFSDQPQNERTVADDGASSVRSSIAAALTELPTCPVCLERLDDHISGIVTTVCNHQFHNECLQRWADTSCPVCRYCLTSGSGDSRCSVCDSSRDLWICLICGHVGCGRYHSGHARHHWQEDGHCYALELSSQRVGSLLPVEPRDSLRFSLRVWDYTNDAYVHRLVHSNKDGRLVEVPAPAAPSSAATQLSEAATSALHSASPDAATAATGSATQERYEAEVQEALVASKLDAIGAEYSARIQSQLEEQLKFFEGRIAATTTDLESRLKASSAAASAAESTAAAFKASAVESNRLRCISDAKLEKASAKVSELARERDILEHLNKQMRSNQQTLKDKLQAETAAASSRTSSQATQIVDLQEQVRDLMMFIEGQRMVQEAHPHLGLHQASATVPRQILPPESTAGSQLRKNGRKR